MKWTAVTVAALAGSATAWPGIGGLMRELSKRQTAGSADAPMIGDLATIGAITPVGKQVKNCLTGNISCEAAPVKTYSAPPLNSLGCLLDTCCVWDYVVQDLVALFAGSDGQCTPLARAAVRLGFHDAAAWDVNSGFGGADGSFLLNSVEQTQKVNNGLQNIRTALLKIQSKYKFRGVGAGDLVQMAHNVATVACPLGPRLLTWVGRTDSSKVNQYQLLPDTKASPDSLIALFNNKTIGIKDLIALIGAHSVANQFFVDPSKAGQPLDSTPGIWDVKFYNESLQATPPPGVFRLPSDGAFAADNETTVGFQVFSNPVFGQAVWNSFYATAYVRLSLLGVQNINLLTDCSKVLPSAILQVPGTPVKAAPSATATTTITPSASPTNGITLLQQLACNVLGICASISTS